MPSKLSILRMCFCCMFIFAGIQLIQTADAQQAPTQVKEICSYYSGIELPNLVWPQVLERSDKIFYGLVRWQRVEAALIQYVELSSRE
jgi:hypothetical protein